MVMMEVMTVVMGEETAVVEIMMYVIMMMGVQG